MTVRVRVRSGRGRPPPLRLRGRGSRRGRSHHDRPSRAVRGRSREVHGPRARQGRGRTRQLGTEGREERPPHGGARRLEARRRGRAMPRVRVAASAIAPGSSYCTICGSASRRASSRPTRDRCARSAKRWDGAARPRRRAGTAFVAPVDDRRRRCCCSVVAALTWLATREEPLPARGSDRPRHAATPTALPRPRSRRRASATPRVAPTRGRVVGRHRRRGDRAARRRDAVRRRRRRRRDPAERNRAASWRPSGARRSWRRRRRAAP